ncbi:MAG: potassium transporter KefB, partial [candidate division Zixibacteria bacterium]|nr:potassium transporter KefB [candidate division Zixibacteria bacterium]
MHEIPILRDVVVIFGVAVLVLLVFHRLRLPPIVGFLMTGMIIGPSGLSLVSSVHEVELLAEIGIILLLFTIGIEFSLTSLLRSKKAVLLGGSVQVILTILLTVLVARMFDVEPARALFYGMLVALSSTAIVLRTLQERAEIDSPPGRTSLAILIFQDIIIVPMIILTPFLSGTSEAASEPVWMIVLKAVGVIVLVVALARFVVPAVLGQVTRTRSRELFLLSIALIAIAVAWLTSKAGLSLSLGAFLAGLIISESEYSLQALDGILPFKDVFTSFFFVSVGMIADLNYIISHPIIIIVGALIVFIAKASLASLASFFLGLSLRAALVAGLALAQVGEFSFILSKVGVHYDLMSEDVYQLFIAVSIFTMAATPFVIAVSPRWAEKLSSIGFLKRLRPASFGELRKPSEQLNN